MNPKKYLFYVSQNYSFAILRPLQAEILRRGDIVHWFLHGNDINADYIKDGELVLSNIHDVIAYKPDAVFVPGNVVPSFISGLKVAVFHGFNVEKRSGSRGHFNIRGCFDLYCTQGPNTTETFKDLAEKHQFFNVVETGWPAIDNLYGGEHGEHKRPTVLLCSTFSPSLSCAEHIFNKVKSLSESGRWQWLVQFHPKMDAKVVEKYKSIQSEHLTFIETDNVIPLLQRADVMVSDTSSIITMFLLLEKPVVTFKNANPKAHNLDINDVELLETSIETALKRPKALMENITEFVNQTHPYKDGKSAERVINAAEQMLAGDSLPKKSKPFNLVRNFKMRKNLNYWKL